MYPTIPVSLRSSSMSSLAPAQYGQHVPQCPRGPSLHAQLRCSTGSMYPFIRFPRSAQAQLRSHASFQYGYMLPSFPFPSFMPSAVSRFAPVLAYAVPCPKIKPSAPERLPAVRCKHAAGIMQGFRGKKEGKTNPPAFGKKDQTPRFRGKTQSSRCIETHPPAFQKKKNHPL
ncbi:hypothetical protein VTK56DRAFT_7845 [Thermocarpiscus australiensis]